MDAGSSGEAENNVDDYIAGKMTDDELKEKFDKAKEDLGDKNYSGIEVGDTEKGWEVTGTLELKTEVEVCAKVDFKWGIIPKKLKEMSVTVSSTTDTNLASCEIHERTKILADGVFRGCINLTSITIPEGVTTIGFKPGMDLAEMISKKAWGKGLKVVIGESDEVYIDCNVILAYGQSVVAVAKTIQEAVTGALESMTGVAVAGVNVNVCGIAR